MPESKGSRWVPARLSLWAMAAGLGWSLLSGLSFPLPGLAPSPGNEPTSGMAAWKVWCLGGIWPLAVLAWVPLAWLVMRAMRESPRRVAVVAVFYAIGAMPFWAFEQWWVSRITAVGYVPMIVYLSIFAWLHCWGAIRIGIRFRQSGALPLLIAAWVLSVEVFRGEIAMKGYPWYLPGHPLINWGPVAWLAGLMGAYGVSLVVLAFSVSLGWIAQKQEGISRVAGWIGVGAAAVMVIPGVVMQPGSEVAPSQIVRIALIQTNVPQDIKMGWGPEQQFKEWQTLEAMTARAAGPTTGLIVWPETMMPGLGIDAESVQAMREAQIFYRVNSAEGEQKLAAHAFADRLVAVQQELNTPIVVGEEGFDKLRFDTVEGGIDIKYDKRYNSAFLVQDGKVDGLRYDKLHLTPFGEEMPYISGIKWLERLLLSVGARGMTFDLSEGRRAVRLLPRVRVSAPGAKRLEPDGMVTTAFPIATPICFEIADSSLVRSIVQATTPSMPMPTAMIVNITNDGWFGDSDKTRRQQVQLGRWRAAELGLPVVRAANTGDSCGFDSWGRPLKPIPLPPAPRSREEGICLIDVPLYSVRTLYAKIGNVVGWLVGGVGCVAFGLSWRRASKVV